MKMASRAKRTATSELNHDNWDQEEEKAEEAGQFKLASDEVIQNRVIKKARRRGAANAEGANNASVFKGFGGFGAGGSGGGGAGLFGNAASTGGSGFGAAAGNFDFLKNAAASTGATGETKTLGFGSSVTPAAGSMFGVKSPDTKNGSNGSEKNRYTTQPK